MEVAFGFQDLQVQYRNGETETVRVSALTIRQYPRLRAVLQDEPAQVELYAGKEQGWADKLTQGSYLEVLKAGEGLNKGFFSQWVERQRQRLEEALSQTTGALEHLQKSNPALLDGLLKKVLEASPTSLPTPASSAGSQSAKP